MLLAFTVVCLGGCAGADAGRGAADEAAGLLATVRVVPERVTVLGYDRARFGGWARVGACNAREAVLAEWFGDGAPAPECGGRGVIADPYTGDDLGPEGADVDHVYPLAAAWDFGAHAWDARRRREFANDVALNLVPVASAVNREKSDLTPAEWLPAPRGLRCGYSVRYLRVAVEWELPVSVADWEAMAEACGVRTRSG